MHVHADTHTDRQTDREQRVISCMYFVYVFRVCVYTVYCCSCCGTYSYVMNCPSVNYTSSFQECQCLIPVSDTTVHCVAPASVSPI